MSNTEHYEDGPKLTYQQKFSIYLRALQKSIKKVQLAVIMHILHPLWGTGTVEQCNYAVQTS